MKCTNCNAGELNPSYIDSLFRAHTCNNCGGNWIRIEDYMDWKDRHPEHEPSPVEVEDIVDRENAMLCPLSGAIMRKMRITKDSSHRLDYSARVGGVWLDKGEWELLKQEGLAGSLSAIVTEKWQRDIKLQKTEQTFEALYRQKFGEQDYEKVKSLREWLVEHPQKGDLRAYLFAEDPYSAKK